MRIHAPPSGDTPSASPLVYAACSPPGVHVSIGPDLTHRPAGVPGGERPARIAHAPDSSTSVGKVLHPVPHDHIEGRRLLPGMSAAANAVKRGGRRGRRTALMVRVARERISTLFALAEREASSGHGELADRYVAIARRVGTRYNVRVLPEYRELYCRGCSAFWVEGRTVRTRLRAGRRVRTCLRCGRERRTLLRGAFPSTGGVGEAGPSGALRHEALFAEVSSDDELPEASDRESEEE